VVPGNGGSWKQPPKDGIQAGGVIRPKPMHYRHNFWCRENCRDCILWFSSDWYYGCGCGQLKSALVANGNCGAAPLAEASQPPTPNLGTSFRTINRTCLRYLHIASLNRSLSKAIMPSVLVDQIQLSQQDPHTYTAGYNLEWTVGPGKFQAHPLQYVLDQ
jgi:hypothetical protein